MKKYLLSTLTAAAAMAVPAWADVELIAGWDFSSASLSEGKIYATSGGTNLYISTASEDTLSNGILYVKPAVNDKTTIDVSGESLTTDEGISVVMTITGWSTSSGGTIFASYETDNTTGGTYAAAIGESGSGTPRSGWGAANGSENNVTTTQSGEGLTYDTNWNNSITVAMTFIGDTLCLYELKDGEYVLVSTSVMNGSNYDSVAGNIEEVAIGSWDGELNGSGVNNITISSVEIWRGDVTTLPEPSMFGLMFGLGAIGLVTTRRRKRA